MSTMIIGIILAVIIALITLEMRKDKRNGKSSCGCSYSQCTMAEKCHWDEIIEGGIINKIKEVNKKYE